MPFGLCNAPVTFQRMMNGIFVNMIGKTVLVYLDDLTIFTKMYEQHLVEIRKVFRKLREEGLYLKPKKCTFATDTMKFLGFVIDRNALRIDQDKVAAVTNSLRLQRERKLELFSA